MVIRKTRQAKRPSVKCGKFRDNGVYFVVDLSGAFR
jgi:hypothetical protein